MAKKIRNIIGRLRILATHYGLGWLHEFAEPRQVVRRLRWVQWWSVAAIIFSVLTLLMLRE